MRKLQFALALLLFLPSLLLAQAPAPSSSTATVSPVDYSQEAFVTEKYYESFRFENDGTGKEQVDVRVKVNSDAGVQALGQLKIGYSALSDKLEIPYVRVIKPDGSTVTAQESAIQDVTYPNALMYSDYHEKHISVPALRPGDVLEYRFVRNIVDPLTPGQFYTAYDFHDHGIVLDEQLEINVPKARAIKLKTEPGADPKVSEEGDRKIYRWQHAHLEDDEDTDRKGKKKPVRRVREEDETPDVQLTTFESWQQVGDWYAGLEKDRRVPNDAVKAKAAELVQGKTTNIEKVKALYDYVSRDYRYVSLSFGLGRYQPHGASEVLANGYGDCKDKNTLLAALLSAEGFDSTSVLIGSQHKLDPDVPSPMQFDHVITRVNVDGQEIWLDSTNGVGPFQMLSYNLRDKQALAVKPDGGSTLVTTPANLPFDSFDRSKLEGALNDTGKLTANFNAVLRGDNELGLRFAMRQIPNNKWKNLFDMMLAQTAMRGAEITNLKVDDPAATDKPFEVSFDLSVSNYFDWSAQSPKLMLPMTGFQLPPVPDDDAKKPKPIKLGDRAEASFAIKLAIPSKYTVKLPIGVDVKRDYAEYHSSYKFENGELVALRKVMILKGEVPYDRRDDFASFRRTVDLDQAQFISLENKAPGTAGLGKEQSPDDLFDSAMQAANANNLKLAIELFERVAKTDPKHKDLWNRLGTVYLADGQYQKAIDTYQKQIQANPYDEYAYVLMGAAYEGLQKYDDAIAQYQKAIEVSPLHASAHQGLGSLYAKLKRWNEAVPELEKAASLQDKNPLIEITLGQAYIATGQTDKGMSAFEQAVALSPTPVVWNNIAYSLAEQNVQLERASQYADAAITALDTQMRDINLDNLRQQDLYTANLLYSVWDTKGWVEYKRGNLDDAERYILATWDAKDTGEVALHLGELAEKRGKKDEAIRYYLLALGGESPSAEAREKLAALGVTGDLDARVAKERAALREKQTLKLNANGKGTGDFFVITTPAGNQQVKFVSGDADIKAMADTVKATNLGITFPDPTSVRALRRGTVSCGTTPPPPKSSAKKPAKGKEEPKAETTPAAKPELVPGPCTVVMVSSEQVRSVE